MIFSRASVGTLISLFLSACCCTVIFSLTAHDFSQHNHTISIHKGDTREPLTVLEAVAHEWLLGLECALCHFVGFESVRLLHFLSSGFLAHFPLEGGNSASSTPAADKADRRVASLDFIGNVQDLDLRVELTSLSKSGVFLVDHHIT